MDSSPAAREAPGWAADVATRGRLDLVVARVFERTLTDLATSRDTDLHDRQLDELSTWCASLPAGMTPAQPLPVDADPPDALLDAARDEHADLLVVGGLGAGGFSHLRLGSVAHHLTHHTTPPLAIIPLSGAAPVEHLVVGVDGSPGSLAAVAVCAELAARLAVGVTAVFASEPSLTACRTATRAAGTTPARG